MRLATLRHEGKEKPAVAARDGYVLLENLEEATGSRWPGDLLELIATGRLDALNCWYRAEGRKLLDQRGIPHIMREQARFAPLYRNPGKIWGIGLNYREHAADLSEQAPKEEPASFMKPDTAIVGHGDPVRIPVQSLRTTGEAEFAVIIGKRCRELARKAWLDAVAGFTTAIDMTAEDILRKNPRYLTRAKSFDTFFSFGPVFLTPDEIPEVKDLNVATVINGKVHARNAVANMTFTPDALVSFHSKGMTWLPGDILSTGTPGAVPLQEGDRIECRIDGFEPLVNPVVDLKRSREPR